jgi:aldose sugar dehydrogenase
VLLRGRYGRLRTIVDGPDGRLYALTSNRDGRGNPADDDDRILRITPPG